MRIIFIAGCFWQFWFGELELGMEFYQIYISSYAFWLFCFLSSVIVSNFNLFRDLWSNLVFSLSSWLESKVMCTSSRFRLCFFYAIFRLTVFSSDPFFFFLKNGINARTGLTFTPNEYLRMRLNKFVLRQKFHCVKCGSSSFDLDPLLNHPPPPFNQPPPRAHPTTHYPPPSPVLPIIPPQQSVDPLSQYLHLLVLQKASSRRSLRAVRLALDWDLRFCSVNDNSLVRIFG